MTAPAKPTIDKCIADSEADVMLFAQIPEAEKQLAIATANQYRKTVGGQIVGWKPLMCESKGGSDYCMHCGRDMGYYANRPPCEALEHRRLAMIPDEMVHAFGCRNETFHAENGEPTEGEACKKWCKQPDCPVSFKEEP